MGVTGLREKILELTGGDISTIVVVSLCGGSSIIKRCAVIEVSVGLICAPQVKAVDPYLGAKLAESVVDLYEKLGSGGQKRKPKIAKVRVVILQSQSSMYG